MRTDQQGQHTQVKLPSESVQLDLICRDLHTYAVDAREKQAPNHIDAADALQLSSAELYGICSTQSLGRALGSAAKLLTLHDPTVADNVLVWGPAWPAEHWAGLIASLPQLEEIALRLTVADIPRLLISWTEDGIIEQSDKSVNDIRGEHFRLIEQVVRAHRHMTERNKSDRTMLLTITKRCKIYGDCHLGAYPQLATLATTSKFENTRCVAITSEVVDKKGVVLAKRVT